MSKASEDTVPQSREILQAFVWLGAWTKAFQLRFQNCQAVFLFQWFTLSTFIYHCKYFARQWWPGNWIYNKSCTRKLSRCQLERCQCHTLVCCIITEAFLPTEVKIISIVSAFTVKINKMYKNQRNYWHNFRNIHILLILMLVYEHNCKGKGANNHPSVKWIKQTLLSFSNFWSKGIDIRWCSLSVQF